MTKTPTWVTWDQMCSRCLKDTYKDYHRYGGRGITVDPDWLDFCNFLRDMGVRPEGKTLDRIDNNLGYCKSNCRWATPKEQANNRRSNKLIEYQGETKTVSQWADHLGVNRHALGYRLRSPNWSIEDTFAYFQDMKNA